jgi:hypothetical protein
VSKGTSRCTPKPLAALYVRTCACSRPRARHDVESALSLALLTTASQARHAPRLAASADAGLKPRYLWGWILAAIEITQLWSCISVGDFTESSFLMPTIPQSIQTLFNDHQARLAAVSAAPGVVGLSLELDQISAIYLSKAVQILVRPKYAADSNTGTSPEDKISSLASSVSRLSKQVRSLAPNDAFYSAFTSGSVAAAQDVFLSIFGLTMPS